MVRVVISSVGFVSDGCLHLGFSNNYLFDRAVQISVQFNSLFSCGGKKKGFLNLSKFMDPLISVDGF